MITVCNTLSNWIVYLQNKEKKTFSLPLTVARKEKTIHIKRLLQIKQLNFNDYTTGLPTSRGFFFLFPQNVPTLLFELNQNKIFGKSSSCNIHIAPNIYVEKYCYNWIHCDDDDRNLIVGHKCCIVVSFINSLVFDGVK